MANYWSNPGETGMDANGADKATNGVDDDGNRVDLEIPTVYSGPDEPDEVELPEADAA